MIRITTLRVLPFGFYAPSYNMALDRRLLELCEEEPGLSFLRFYGWDPPALSLGFFEPAEAVDLRRVAECGIEVVRRPTGGRVVFHHGDLTYTVVVPRQAASPAAVYRQISECIMAGLSSLGASVCLARGAVSSLQGRTKPCFLSASRHEIVCSGKKMVGSAQRLGRGAVLQHGSIPVGRGYLGVVDYISCTGPQRALLRSEMLAATTCLEEVLGRPVQHSHVASALLEAFAAGFGCDVARCSAWDFAAPLAAGPAG